jgi:hypothetical protein
LEKLISREVLDIREQFSAPLIVVDQQRIGGNPPG